jgi:tripeptide aminopeptidase
VAYLVNASRLLGRFVRYVQIDTTACDGATTYPSSPGQWELGRLLVAELLEMGLADAEQDGHGLVWASLPANVPSEVPLPVVALCAHLDTSPETTGRGVRPQVFRHYQGQDLVLPGDPSQVIRVADNPELAELRGKTIITSDGTTLLGADDKAGVAVIMELVHTLVEHPHLARPPLRILFTCDEEIGRGVDYVDLARLGATVAYTLDGHGSGQIDVETFSADLATLHIRGINIHPSIAKGRMVNAVRAAAALIDRLPRDRLAPEVTSGREGFLHPYSVQGGVAEVTLKVLLRDFQDAALADYARLLRTAADEVERQFPGCRIELEITPQYRNLAQGLAREPRAVRYAQEALRRLGRPCRLTIVRGGTDGALLTQRGLPTPNLSTGEHNPHSPLEWTCLEEMVEAVEMLVELARLWVEQP